MTMPTKTYNDYGKDAAFLMSEAPGRSSREQAILAAHATQLPGGTVLGQITASGKFVPVNPAAADGSQTAVAILLLGQAPSTGDQRAAIVARSCEVAARMLSWPAGITASQKLAAEQQLATKNILVRY